MKVKIKLMFISLVWLCSTLYPQNDNTKVSGLYSIADQKSNSHEYYSEKDSLMIVSAYDPVQKEINIMVKDSVKETSSGKAKSFFSSDLFYFIGTSALAVVIYLLLPEDNADVEQKLTFGKPPTPK